MCEDCTKNSSDSICGDPISYYTTRITSGTRFRIRLCNEKLAALLIALHRRNIYPGQSLRSDAQRAQQLIQEIGLDFQYRGGVANVIKGKILDRGESLLDEARKWGAFRQRENGTLDWDHEIVRLHLTSLTHAVRWVTANKDKYKTTSTTQTPRSSQVQTPQSPREQQTPRSNREVQPRTPGSGWRSSQTPHTKSPTSPWTGFSPSKPKQLTTLESYLDHKVERDMQSLDAALSPPVSPSLARHALGRDRSLHLSSPPTSSSGRFMSPSTTIEPIPFSAAMEVDATADETDLEAARKLEFTEEEIKEFTEAYRTMRISPSPKTPIAPVADMGIFSVKETEDVQGSGLDAGSKDAESDTSARTVVKKPESTQVLQGQVFASTALVTEPVQETGSVQQPPVLNLAQGRDVVLTTQAPVVFTASQEPLIPRPLVQPQAQVFTFSKPTEDLIDFSVPTPSTPHLPDRKRLPASGPSLRAARRPKLTHDNPISAIQMRSTLALKASMHVWLESHGTGTQVTPTKAQLRGWLEDLEAAKKAVIDELCKEG